VREAGGAVAFTAYEHPLGAPLDVEPRSPVVAARTERALRQLATVPLGPRRPPATMES
jgi:myo-inositol-1(or 4)-monophosphatase